MAHPDPRNRTHDSFNRCAFRQFSEMDMNKSLSDAIHALPAQEWWHGPLELAVDYRILQGYIDTLKNASERSPPTSTAQPGSRDQTSMKISSTLAAYMFKTGQAAIGHMEPLGQLLHSISLQKCLDLATDQFTALAGHFLALLKQLEDLALIFSDGTGSPTGASICKMVKILRDIYALAPAYTIIFERPRVKKANRTAAGIVGSVASFGLAAVTRYFPRLITHSPALMFIGIYAGYDAAQSGSQWYNTANTVIINEELSSCVGLAAYFAVLGLMLANGLQNPHDAEHDYQRQFLMKDLHCNLLIPANLEQYSAHSIAQVIKQMDASFREFEMRVAKLGIKINGQWDYTASPRILALMDS